MKVILPIFTGAAKLATAVALTLTLAAAGSLPALWPTFSTPSTVATLDLRPYATNNMVNPDNLALTTFMGAYNQRQAGTRIFIINSNEDAYWLAQLLPSTITQSSISWNQSIQNGALEGLLTSYGSGISGAIVYDPANPESVNVATTLAGIDDAMVISPAEESIVTGDGISILADLRNTTWVGSNATLVGNTTINLDSNPSGGSGNSGYALAYGGSGASLTTITGPQLQWTVNGSLGHDDWVYYVPAVASNTTYVFSMQVSGSGAAFMDVWDGVQDWQTSQVTLSSTPQTLQLIVTIPASSGSPQIQARTHGVTAATVNIQNVAVIRADTASEEYAYQNYMSQANHTILAILNPGAQSTLRDYLIAAKIFTFYLSGVDHPDQATLMTNIIATTPHNTPIMGYIYDEGRDVPFLSSATLGHFLNASDFYSNGSLWAAVPGPTSLTEPAPAAVNAQNGTIYVGQLVSDGDNAQYVEGFEQMEWTESQFLGAVPQGWTEAPAMIDFSPTMLAHFNTFLPQSSELAAGPSGVGYATAETGSDLTTLGTLTGEAMAKTGMSTVTDWFVDSTTVPAFATAAAVPHVVHHGAYTYALDGSTVLDGQTVDYQGNAQLQVNAIESASSGWSSGSPLFIEALVNGWGMSPDDILWVAQQLQLNTGHNYVFLTPTELALTEKAYHAGTTGLPNTNTQAVSGTQLLAEYPNNLVWNSSGLDGGQGLGGGWTTNTLLGGEYWNCCTTFSNQGAELFYVPANAGSDQWVFTPNAVPAAPAPYIFSISVAGSGQCYLDVNDGTNDYTSSVVTLSSTFQTLRLSAIVQSTNVSIEVRVHNQSTPTTVYFQNGSFYVPNWQMSYAGSSGNSLLSTTTYQNGPAFQFQVAPSLGHDLWVQTGPPVTAGSTYTFSVDVAGTGSAFLDAWNGSADVATSAVTLTSAYQTLKTTATITAYPGPLLQVRSSSSSSGANIYFRNASVTPNNYTVDFATGLETGDPQPSWTSTVDTSGGGISNVSSDVLTLAGSGQTHGGGNDLLYSGTASGGSTDYVYMKVFSSSVTLTANTRLSYWIYPQSPKGLEANASSSTGTNSTCVAIDMIFSDGSDLRDSGVTDQYGNQLHPAHQCNHLQPDQWNYVTASLGALSGKIISRINVGYDQPGGSGMYRGCIDDILVKN